MEIDPRVRLRHLKTFIEVARSASLGKAAARLNVSQPAVSKTLSELEEMLGARLVSRGRGGATLTPVGRMFHSYASASLAALSQDDQWVRMEFDVSPSFANPTGAVQGGFISAMLDEAMSTAVIIASNVTMTAPTLEMKTSYLKRLMPGKASVEARILRLGKSACFMEAECFDAEGALVAKATAM